MPKTDLRQIASMKKIFIKDGSGVNAFSIVEFALPLAGGLLAALAFPDFGLWPLVWGAPAFLLFSIRNASILKSTLYGFLYGFSFSIVTISWVYNTMVNFGGLHSVVAVLVTILMAGALGLYPALFTNILSRISQSIGYSTALSAAPFVWVSIEFIRERIPLIGFPWARLADSQYSVPTVIQIAELVGAEGISFFIMTVSAGIAGALSMWVTPGEKNGAWRWAIMALIFALFPFLYGTVRLNTLDLGGTKIKVAMLQGNIDQKIKWDPNWRKFQVNRYLSMSKIAADKGAELIVWPETAAPYYFDENPYYDFLITDFAKEHNVTLLFGAPVTEKKGGKNYSLNRAWVVSPNGATDHYDKVHLVPFGEYVPLSSLLFFVRAMTANIGEIKPGEKLNLLRSGKIAAGVQICFEIVFPKYSRELAANGANMLVTITNDSWFGYSASSEQALAMATLRAVENRIPVLRAAQTGVSAIVTADGRIHGKTKLFEQDISIATISLIKSGITFYTWSGDLFRWLSLLITASLLFIATKKRYIQRPLFFSGKLNN